MGCLGDVTRVLSNREVHYHPKKRSFPKGIRKNCQNGSFVALSCFELEMQDHCSTNQMDRKSSFNHVTPTFWANEPKMILLSWVVLFLQFLPQTKAVTTDDSSLLFDENSTSASSHMLEQERYIVVGWDLVSEGLGEFCVLLMLLVVVGLMIVDAALSVHALRSSNKEKQDWNHHPNNKYSKTALLFAVVFVLPLLDAINATREAWKAMAPDSPSLGKGLVMHHVVVDNNALTLMMMDTTEESSTEESQHLDNDGPQIPLLQPFWCLGLLLFFLNRGCSSFKVYVVGMGLLFRLPPVFGRNDGIGEARDPVSLFKHPEQPLHYHVLEFLVAWLVEVGDELTAWCLEEDLWTYGLGLLFLVALYVIFYRIVCSEVPAGHKTMVLLYLGFVAVIPIVWEELVGVNSEGRTEKGLLCAIFAAVGLLVLSLGLTVLSVVFHYLTAYRNLQAQSKDSRARADFLQSSLKLQMDQQAVTTNQLGEGLQVVAENVNSILHIVHRQVALENLQRHINHPRRFGPRSDECLLPSRVGGHLREQPRARRRVRSFAS